MFRALTLAVLLALLPCVASGQAQGVLHITVTLIDAARTSMPVPRHALLISDNPATSSPRRVVTGPDGTVDVRLRPGNYTVESDEPVAFDGKGYQWTVTVDLAAGGGVTLELTAANAEIGAAPAAASSPVPRANEPALLLPQWKDSVVALWTPTARASGFIVDPTGLILTSQRAVGTAAAVEVQFSAAVKVAARVLVSDAARDVAVLWVDPVLTATLRPVPLDCANGSVNAVAEGQRVAAIGAPLHGQKEVSTGEVVRVEPRAVTADFRLASGSTGGPVFGADGSVVGLTSSADEQDGRRRRDARIVPLADGCEAMRVAQNAIPTAVRPVGTLLPVEPATPVPSDALAAAAKARAGNLAPYQLSTSDFELALITPAMVYAAQQDPQRAAARGRGPQGQPGGQAAPTDFGDWSEYFADAPPVLIIRVTPKQVEGFWTTVARGAAYTQGVSLPPIKHFKPGFSRLRAFCGDAEVTPIHPFTLEQRVSETDAIREGLYVFDPQAFGPHCKSVRLSVYSEKDPAKDETRAVEPLVIDRIWQDFAPVRAAAEGAARP